MAKKEAAIDILLDASDEQGNERVTREMVEQVLARLRATKGKNRKANLRITFTAATVKHAGRAAKKSAATKPFSTPLWLDAFQRRSMVHGASEWSLMNSLLLSTYMASEPVTDDEGLMELANKRIAFRSVRALASRLDQKPERLARHFGIVAEDFEGNANRKIPKQATERALETVAVTAKGLELFTTQDALNQWLNAPQEDLAGRKPIDLMDGSLGTKKVLRLLDTMIHGVYT